MYVVLISYLLCLLNFDVPYSRWCIFFISSRLFLYLTLFGCNDNLPLKTKTNKRNLNKTWLRWKPNKGGAGNNGGPARLKTRKKGDLGKNVASKRQKVSWWAKTKNVWLGWKPGNGLLGKIWENERNLQNLLLWSGVIRRQVWRTGFLSSSEGK